MDADSSYGGSDTAQDSHSSLDNSHSSHNISKHDQNEDTVTTAVHVIPDTTENQTPANHYYHKNEITVPVNLDDTDFQKNTDSKLHYMATANLNINESLEHHNNLDEMSKNYKSQHKLQESFSKKSKHSTSSGIDNPAFIEDVKSTFNNDMPYSNGLTPDPSKTNNHEPVTEAVNLELINMKPGGAAHHNGLKGYDSSGMTTIPLKKDEDDMRSPYDEYFVPVNEHRKYMRGEKLYVTKDNRVEKRKGKCICWTICIALAAIAVIIGILAAAGLLVSQPPMPQAVEASGRSFDNNIPIINKGGISLPTKGQNHHPITPEPPITTVSSIIPSTDQTQIQVPRVIESEFKIDNLEFSTRLLDKDSLEYKALSEAIERQIKESLLSNKELRNGTVNFDIKVMEMLPGSVVAKYRITWKPKDEYSYNYLENTNVDPINEVSLNRILIEYLQRHRDLMGEFHVQENSIKSQRVLDLCKIQNNGCEHFCVFDYTRLNFACLCPEGQHLSTDQKRCKMDINNSYTIPEPETTTKPPRAILKHTTEPFTTPEPITEPTSKSEPVAEDSQEEHFFLGTSSTTTEKDYSMDFVFLPQDVSSSMGDFRELTTTSVFSAIPVEFPTEKSPDEIHTWSNENKDTEKIYLNPIFSGPPTENTTETTQKPFTKHVNNQHDSSYIPNLTVFPETENKTEIDHKLEILHTGNPTSEYSMGNVYTPPAEVHFDITTKKSSMYMIQVLKPLTYKEKYREPKIQELHTNPINSSETDNNGTDHDIEAMGHPEQIHDEYNMSPFLPELDNDTFVNSLHSEEHFVEHDNHDNVSTIKPPSMEIPTTTTPSPPPVTETFLPINIQNNLAQMSPTILEVTNTKAPSLEFDELNTTNPFDNKTSDATNLNGNEQFITKDLEIEPLKPEVMIIISDKNDMTTEPVTIVEENDIDGTTAEVTTTNYLQTPVEEEIIVKKYIPQLFENKTTEQANINKNADEYNTTVENYNNVQEYPSTLEQNNVIIEETSSKQTTTTESNKITENLSTTESNEITENLSTTESNEITENFSTTESNETINGEKVINTTTEEPEVPSFTYAINTTEENTFNILEEENTLNSDVQSSTENTTNVVIDLDEIITTEKTIMNNNASNGHISAPVIMPVETTTIMEFTTDQSSVTETSTEFTQQTTTMQSENINNIEESTMALNKIESETVLSIENSTNTTNIKNFNDIASSTEDLIALETTTNTEGSTISVKNEVKTVSIENKTTTEATDTVTTVINANQYENEEEDNRILTENNQITSTVPYKEYQVEETVSDITTTEKLFVTHKTTTTLKTEEDSTENLSIIPLDGDQSHENEQNGDVLFKSKDSSDEKGETLNEILRATTKNEEKPITEDFVLPKASRCSQGQFQCLNGTSVKDGNYCIQIEDRCDSVLDCSDGSDEINCMEEGCPNNFQCASKQCLKRYLVCDGILNCNDGSDEVNCESWSCNSNEISCGISNRCIPASWKCDGRKHCPDGSDEEGCVQNGPCPAQSFRCTEESSCMPNSWKCDGQADCPGGEDESSCFCTEEEFKCITGGGCIAKSDRCDGIAQCLDKSDEWDCLKLDKLILNLTDTNDKEILQLQVENNTWYPICMDWTTWNTTFADLVCQKLGYSASSALESVPKPKNSTSQISYVLLTDQQRTLNFVENNIPNCDQYVSISCQEYVCGSPSAFDVPSARIVGGDKAAPTQWPSLALLFNKKHNIYCTSTLVTPLWAVTSYSCIAGRTSQPINKEDWFLYAGGTNKGDNVTSQVRKLNEIVTHPQTKFSNFGFKNDAVLLKMKKPVLINLNVSAVCLPNNGIEPRQLCVVAGWGINKPGEPTIQQYLHYLPVPLIDTEECNSTKHYNGKIASDKICAGYTDSDKTPCFNDEGAPLMCFSDKTATWELHGLLSHHGNCGSTNKHPAIYTAINPTLTTWMSHIIGSQALAVS